MGPRPPDFDEELVRRSPTFRKWMGLLEGETLKYACREFTKGTDDDEERLMRRIMIARRNNIRDHKALLKARELSYKKQQHHQRVVVEERRKPFSSTTSPLLGAATATSQDASLDIGDEGTTIITVTNNVSQPWLEGNNKDTITNGPGTVENDLDLQPQKQNLEDDEEQQQLNNNLIRRRRRPSTFFSDAELAQEMDIAAVVATRSYRTWLKLPEGAEFLYNQKYIKGRDGHDWLLRKNIWRRMRYRRDNKKMMEEMLQDGTTTTTDRQRCSPRSSSTIDTATVGISMNNASQSMDADVRNNLHHQSNIHGAISTASHIVDQALLTTPAVVTAGMNLHHDDQDATTAAAVATAASILGGGTGTDHDIAAVEAAVAAAESYAISPYVHNPLDATDASTDTGLGLALDAAARLAAAATASSAVGVIGVVDGSTLEAATEDAVVLAAATAAAAAAATAADTTHL
jgi:hypothetical protein